MTVKGTIVKLKKLFLKVKDWKDAIDGFLVAFKWVLTLIGAISFGVHYFTYKKFVSKEDELRQKNDTIRITKEIIIKSSDPNPDTVVKYKNKYKRLFEGNGRK